MIPWLAWPAALLMGVSLGMLGSGGSILTVPILRTICGLETPVAIATSFPIVGLVALAGLAGYARSGSIRWREVVPFVATSVPAAFLSRTFLEPLLSMEAQTYSFAALMVVVAWRMVAAPEVPARERHPALVLFAAVLVGTLTGCLGVGGGFVIVPALVLMLGFPPKAAVATSLLVIAGNCGASVIAEALHPSAEIRWDRATRQRAVNPAGPTRVESSPSTGLRMWIKTSLEWAQKCPLPTH